MIKTTYEVPRINKIEVVELQDFNLIMVGDNEWFHLDSFNKVKTQFLMTKEVLISHFENAKHLIKRLEIKIPKGCKLYEKKSANVSLVSQEYIDMYKAGATSLDDYDEEKACIPAINWVGMDGTLWIYNRKTDYFEPVNSVIELLFHNSLRETLNMNKVLEYAKNQSWYDGYREYDEHCEDCGGKTIGIKYKQPLGDAGKVSLDNLDLIYRLFPSELTKRI